MRSIADDLRDDTVRRVRALPMRERIALALALGQADLERFMHATGLGRAAAVRVLAARHAEGRTPSVANAIASCPPSIVSERCSKSAAFPTP